MQVEFVTPETDRKEFYRKLFAKPNQALVFSRLEAMKELIAIVPVAAQAESPEDQKFLWVHLSGEEGAYCDPKGRGLENTINTIIQGEWIYQPNAKMVLEKGRMDV